MPLWPMVILAFLLAWTSRGATPPQKNSRVSSIGVLAKIVSQERLQKMIVTKITGPEIPLGDPRTVALEAYRKSLR